MTCLLSQTLNSVQRNLSLSFLMCFFDDVDFASFDATSPVDVQIKPAFKPHAKFSIEDDEALRRLVEEFGENNWTMIVERMPGRNVRQCKERWMNYLSPNLNRSPWTPEEDALLIKKQKELGSKWVKISQFFQNRTDAMVKNRFQVLRRKELKEKELQARREQYLSSSSCDERSASCSSPVIVEAPEAGDEGLFSFVDLPGEDIFSDIFVDDFGFVF